MFLYLQHKRRIWLGVSVGWVWMNEVSKADWVRCFCPDLAWIWSFDTTNVERDFYHCATQPLAISSSSLLFALALLITMTGRFFDFGLSLGISKLPPSFSSGWWSRSPRWVRSAWRHSVGRFRCRTTVQYVGTIWLPAVGQQCGYLTLLFVSSKTEVFGRSSWKDSGPWNKWRSRRQEQLLVGYQNFMYSRYSLFMIV